MNLFLTRTVLRVVAIGLVLIAGSTAIAELTSSRFVALAQSQADAEAYKVWYDANASGDIPRAFHFASLYLNRFPDGRYSYFLRNWILSCGGVLFRRAAETKNLPELIRIGKEVLAQHPDSLDYLSALVVQIRTNELFAQPPTFAHAYETADFAERAIRLIEAGNTPTGAGPNFNKNVTLAYMYQTLAVSYEHDKNGDKALAQYERAVALDPYNAAYFFHCGRIHNDKYAAATKKYEVAQEKVSALPGVDLNVAQPKPEVRAAIDESKAALKEVNSQADAIIACWTRFLELTSTENTWGDTRSKVEKAFTDLYKYRHNGSVEGLTTRTRTEHPGKTAESEASHPSNDSDRSPTPRQIAERVMPSVVSLEMHQADRTVTLGSGFFVRQNVVATNYHVIKGSSWGYARAAVGERFYVSKILAVDKQQDLALLEVTGTKGLPLVLGDSAEVAVGDTVYVVGNPEGLEGTFSQGIVSGLRQKAGLIQITAPISHGSSGSPVLDDKGRVVGIAVGAFKEGQNLNFAVPVSYLRLLCETIR